MIASPKALGAGGRQGVVGLPWKGLQWTRQATRCWKSCTKKTPPSLMLASTRPGAALNPSTQRRSVSRTTTRLGLQDTFISHFTTFPSLVSGGVACQWWGGGVCSCVRPSVLFLIHRGTQRCSLFAQCSVRSEQVVQGYTLAQKTQFHSFNQLHSTHTHLHTALTRCCLSTHTTDSPTPSFKGALSQTHSSSCRQELLGWRQSSTHRYVWAARSAVGHFNKSFFGGATKMTYCHRLVDPPLGGLHTAVYQRGPHELSRKIDTRHRPSSSCACDSSTCHCCCVCGRSLFAYPLERTIFVGASRLTHSLTHPPVLACPRARILRWPPTTATCFSRPQESNTSRMS
jgi:hypothetical protein